MVNGQRLLQVRQVRDACIQVASTTSIADEAERLVVDAEYILQFALHVAFLILLHQLFHEGLGSRISLQAVVCNLCEFGSLGDSIVEGSELIYELQAESLLACPHATLRDGVNGFRRQATPCGNTREEKQHLQQV